MTAAPRNESNMEADDAIVKQDTSTHKLIEKISSSNAQPAAPGRETPKAQSSSTYKPQFTGTSALILDRLRKSRDSINTTGFKSSESTPGGNETTSELSTMPMPRPVSDQHPPAWSDIQTRLLQLDTQNLKRKLDKDSPQTDFTKNTIPFRAPLSRLSTMPFTQPIKAAESVDTHKCQKCDASSQASKSSLITCHGCHHAWHLHCLLTIVEPTDSKDHLCPDCKTRMTGADQVHTEASANSERQRIVDRIRRRRLSKLPTGIVPAKPELVGFLAGQTSSAERTEYFYSKKRTDLLNILSLSDQLRPQLLVDILVSVSKKHPNLPIFDDPDWRENLPSQASVMRRKSGTTHSRVTSHSKSGPAMMNAKERKPRGRPRMMKQIHVAETSAAEVEDAAIHVGSDGENSLPSTWPMPGEGLYAKLPPEDEDRAFLVDDNDEEAFSHFMVDKSGRQVVVPACA